jgi:rare lipoprotein A
MTIAPPHCGPLRRALVALVPVVLLAGCATPAGAPAPSTAEPGAGAGAPTPGAQPPSAIAALPPAGSGRGGYYLDDGPGGEPPPDLERIPDAQPRAEPLHRFANRPYTVFGRDYVPMTLVTAHRERGMASWYGRKFHGQKTSSGEVYDMYGMTAAHPTLPIPSYVRVTNMRNGRSVVLRVNDRGPFLHGRVIDVSYTAALKLDFVRAGSVLVDVELVGPGDVAQAPDADVSQQPIAEPPRLVVETLLGDGEGWRGDVQGDQAGQAAQTAQTAQAAQTAQTAQAAPAGPAVLVGQPTPKARAGSSYLQLGAFSSRERADAAAARFKREFRWLNVPIGVIAESGLFKVQAGPWPSREQAMQAADRIADVLTTRPLAVTR